MQDSLEFLAFSKACPRVGSRLSSFDAIKLECEGTDSVSSVMTVVEGSIGGTTMDARVATGDEIDEGIIWKGKHASPSV